MCGIIGYIGPREAAPIILGGLRRLEYRGYDSAGIALLQGDSIYIERAVGKLANLEIRVANSALSTQDSGLTVGVGHTRWATHGAPNERNAHPHLSMDGRVAVVHNGIVENFAELKRDLQAEGAVFASDTDTEVIVHLVERYLRAGCDLERAAHAAIKQLQGSQAIVLVCLDEPDKLIAARIGNAGGVSIGLGDGEMFVASDIPGILEHTRQIIFLDSHEVAVVEPGGLRVRRLDGEIVHKHPHHPWDPVSAEKGEYRHFMQKEIYEQARAITDTLRGRVDFQTGEVVLEGMPDALDAAQRLQRIYTVACGTSAHSGLIGKFLIEGLARIPVEVDYGIGVSLPRPADRPDIAALGITQSGETADTLAAMQEARQKGAAVWSIINAVGSQAQRASRRPYPDARRPRDRRRQHQGIHDLDRGPIPAGAVSGAGTTDATTDASSAMARRPSRGPSRQRSGPSAQPGQPHAGAGAAIRRIGQPASTTASTSCTWAAASTTRWRWKGR